MFLSFLDTVCSVLGCAHLIFLLESIPLPTFHLRDVLQQVGDSDGGLELSGLELTCRKEQERFKHEELQII